MNIHIRPLFLLSLLIPTAAAQSGSSAARLEVNRGRAVLLNDGRAERTLRTGESEITHGSSHIEIGTGSEVRLSWPGMASLHIWGPSSLRWSVSPAESEDDVPSLSWNISDLAWCDLEVRRGSHELRIPGDWTAQIKPGAVYLRGLPSGPVEMRLHAGQPVRLDWNGDSSQARPPVMVNPGSSVRLERPDAAPVDKSSRARVWDKGAGWPYRRRSDSLAQRAERMDLSRRTQRQDAWPMPKPKSNFGPAATRAKVSERPIPSRVTVTQDPLPVPQVPKQMPEEPKPVLEPAPELPPELALVLGRIELSAEPKDFPAKPQDLPLEPQIEAPQVKKPEPKEPEVLERSVPVVEKPEPVVEKPESVVLPTPVLPTAPQAERFQVAQWGGLTMEQLIPCGEFAVERSPRVEIRMFSEGRRKVLVDSQAGAPIQVLTSQADHRMHPGSVAVFASDGSILIAFGKMDSAPVPSGRSAFSTFAK